MDPSSGVHSQASALVSKSSRLAVDQTGPSQARRPDDPSSIKFLKRYIQVLFPLERFEEHEENRQGNKYHGKLHGQPGNDRNRQRSLHGRALAYAQS